MNCEPRLRPHLFTFDLLEGALTFYSNLLPIAEDQLRVTPFTDT
jgi:hypothetical protein